MSERLLPPRFGFRFSAPCHYHEPLWTASGPQLGPSFRLPSLADLDEQHSFADVRVAWSESGLALAVQVSGKRRPPWCRESRPDESDGLRVWIDTRDTHNIHRASRFCHQFIFLPAGSGRNLSDPYGELYFINRARENPKPVRPEALKTRTEKRVDGYVLEALIPAAAITGWDPAEHKRLGFTYAIVDQELGEQAFSCGKEFPYREDPSVWATLELVR
jgi:Carbohydrate family 9 binding domain-like